MQLDRTRIAVRERGTMELLDISWHVLRCYGRPLLLTMLLGVLPLLALNHLLLGWLLTGVEFRSTWSLEEAGNVVRYVWNMSLLVFIEAPLASIAATAFLGQAVFLEQPKLRQLLRELLPLAPALAWCHLVVRGVLPAWLLLAMARGSQEYTGWEALLILLAMYAMGLRAFRPYINEIAILERLPLWKSRQAPMTLGRRSALLHNPSGADLLARWLCAALVACLLVLGVYGVCLFLSGVLLNQWRPTPLLLLLALPLSMWFVVGYIGVLRFMSYLDLRIRHEGWEVELRLRAEAARLASRLV
ncbi:MAG: hypothetical protein J5I93_00220 [Pirellulaceae bacterium]|nr:hypothetical protein [Pirellulaceae bacterium]